MPAATTQQPKRIQQQLDDIGTRLGALEELALPGGKGGVRSRGDYLQLFKDGVDKGVTHSAELMEKIRLKLEQTMNAYTAQAICAVDSKRKAAIEDMGQALDAMRTAQTTGESLWDEVQVTCSAIREVDERLTSHFNERCEFVEALAANLEQVANRKDVGQLSSRVTGLTKRMDSFQKQLEQLQQLQFDLTQELHSSVGSRRRRAQSPAAASASNEVRNVAAWLATQQVADCGDCDVDSVATQADIAMRTAELLRGRPKGYSQGRSRSLSVHSDSFQPSGSGFGLRESVVRDSVSVATSSHLPSHRGRALESESAGTLSSVHLPRPRSDSPCSLVLDALAC